MAGPLTVTDQNRPFPFFELPFELQLFILTHTDHETYVSFAVAGRHCLHLAKDFQSILRQTENAEWRVYDRLCLWFSRLPKAARETLPAPAVRRVIPGGFDQTAPTIDSMIGFTTPPSSPNKKMPPKAPRRISAKEKKYLEFQKEHENCHTGTPISTGRNLRRLEGKLDEHLNGSPGPTLTAKGCRLDFSHINVPDSETENEDLVLIPGFMR